MNNPTLPGLPEIDPSRERDIQQVRGYKRLRARAHARRTDPETSHKAAASVENLTSKQAAILEMLRMGPACDSEIYDRLWKAGYKMSDSGARTRRDELVERGLVEFADRYVTLKSGSRSRVWQLLVRD